MQSVIFLHLISKRYKTMRKTLVCGLLLLSTVSFAQESSSPVSSTIDSVTVFLNGAQVHRTGRVSLRAGDHSYRLEQVSPYTDPQSIRLPSPR